MIFFFCSLGGDSDADGRSCELACWRTAGNAVLLVRFMIDI